MLVDELGWKTFGIARRTFHSFSGLGQDSKLLASKLIHLSFVSFRKHVSRKITAIPSC